MDALLQKQHNLSSKLWIKFEKEAKYGTNLSFRVTSSKKFKNKTFPLVFGDFGAVPKLLSGTVQRDAVWKRSSVRYLVMISGGGPHNRPLAQMCESFLAGA